MPEPYYEDTFVRLYHGDCREVLPALEDRFDLAVTDPPYGETSLAWNGARRAHQWTDDGTRALSSVIECQTMRMRGTGHPTEKPTGILEPLITYGCPAGGTVLDPFAGSGSTGAAAKATGRRAVLIEADETYCEIAARRLAQDVLPFEEAGC